MLYGLPVPLKFLIAIIYDLTDLMSVPFLGTLYDAVGIPLGVLLWGPVGLVNTWEIVDPTDQIDKFVPTMTLAGILQYYGKVG